MSLEDDRSHDVAQTFRSAVQPQTGLGFNNRQPVAQPVPHTAWINPPKTTDQEDDQKQENDTVELH